MLSSTNIDLLFSPSTSLGVIGFDQVVQLNDKLRSHGIASDNILFNAPPGSCVAHSFSYLFGGMLSRYPVSAQGKVNFHQFHGRAFDCVGVVGHGDGD